jgi:hypothetical protein
MAIYLPIVKPPTISTTKDNFIYFEPPPFIETVYKYQNVNIDKDLQNKVTMKFLNKTINWIQDDSNFNKYKKYLSLMKSDEGYDIIHKILRLFVKKGNTNWYDLSRQESLIKDFIKYKLHQNL